MRIFFLFAGMVLSCLPLRAQDTSIFSLPIQMDEFVLKASKEGWDVEGFIRRVKEDTTFYKAFKTLRIIPYTAVNDIRIFGKKQQLLASLHSETRQLIEKGCRRTEVITEKVTGDFYTRKKEYRYYTAELYAYLFFSEQPVCGENNIVAGAASKRGSGRIEKNKEQLKQLIFNPGSRIAGIPLSGNKAAMFDPDIAAMYDFKLLRTEYEGEECYLFSAKPKEKYKGKVVYNELNTWFRTADDAIVARDYALSYKTLVYDFDVRMKVRLKMQDGVLIPATIGYSGNWHIATQKRERASFLMELHY